ncbi:protein ORF143 [Cyprinid herpesvirus 2]|nr:protein ORF143 [Cyprinid herpesvirus 2]
MADASENLVVVAEPEPEQQHQQPEQPDNDQAEQQTIQELSLELATNPAQALVLQKLPLYILQGALEWRRSNRERLLGRSSEDSDESDEESDSDSSSYVDSDTDSEYSDVGDDDESTSQDPATPAPTTAYSDSSSDSDSDDATEYSTDDEVDEAIGQPYEASSSGSDETASAISQSDIVIRVLDSDENFFSSSDSGHSSGETDDFQEPAAAAAEPYYDDEDSCYTLNDERALFDIAMTGGMSESLKMQKLTGQKLIHMALQDADVRKNLPRVADPLNELISSMSHYTDDYKDRGFSKEELERFGTSDDELDLLRYHMTISGYAMKTASDISLDLCCCLAQEERHSESIWNGMTWPEFSVVVCEQVRHKLGNRLWDPLQTSVFPVESRGHDLYSNWTLYTGDSAPPEAIIRRRLDTHNYIVYNN